jgi:hypothetical protein
MAQLDLSDINSVTYIIRIGSRLLAYIQQCESTEETWQSDAFNHIGFQNN